MTGHGKRAQKVPERSTMICFAMHTRNDTCFSLTCAVRLFTWHGSLASELMLFSFHVGTAGAL